MLSPEQARQAHVWADRGSARRIGENRRGANGRGAAGASRETCGVDWRVSAGSREQGAGRSVQSGEDFQLLRTRAEVRVGTNRYRWVRKHRSSLSGDRSMFPYKHGLPMTTIEFKSETTGQM